MRDLLLVIDMQNVYAEGGEWHCPNTDAAAENVKSLIAESKGKIDVAFTRFLASETPTGVWKQYNIENAAVNEDAYSNEMLSIFEDELQEYPLYTKSVYSSLAIPEVRELAMNADRVLLSGVVAECCVLATAMAMIDAGIPIIYLTDAVAGISPETEAATELVLAGLEPLHVQRMTTKQYQEQID